MKSPSYNIYGIYIARVIFESSNNGNLTSFDLTYVIDKRARAQTLFITASIIVS